MKRFQKVWMLTGSAWVSGVLWACGQSSEKAVPTPSFQEVQAIVRSNLVHLSEAELNRASVDGLLSELKGQAVLVRGEKAATPGETRSYLVSMTTIFDGAYGYIRLVRVDAGLAKAFDSAWQELSATNKFKGLVLDLRFAEGVEYAEVAEVAGRFLDKEQPLFKEIGRAHV